MSVRRLGQLVAAAAVIAAAAAVPAAPALADRGDITSYPSGSGNPRDVALGADGNLWVAQAGNGRIARVTPAGVATAFPRPDGSEVRGIAAGPDGNLWFTASSGPPYVVGRITTAGVMTDFTDPGVNIALGISVGPDGAMWFTSFGNDRIGRIDVTTGQITTFTDPEGE